MSMSKPPLVLDFETRSPLDIREVGIYRYVEDPRTDVLCYAAKRGDNEGYYLHPGDAPDWLLDGLADDTVILHAHNSTVERLIIREIMGPRYGWPVPKGRRWRCSAARARRLALPGSLDKLGAALGLADELTKDKEGKNLIRRLSKPIKRTPEGFVYDNDPAKLERFGQYCLQDVVAEHAAECATLDMPPKEIAYYHLTEIINDRGVRVDVPLIRRLVWRANEAVEELNSRLREITRGEVQALTQVAKLKAWVKRETGVELLTLRKEDMDGLVKEGQDKSLPGYVIEALKIRQEGAKSSVSKLLAILNRVSADGRVHGAFVYHGASTGRYTSMGVQLQNLVRDTLKNYEAEIQELETFTLTQISKAIRGVFIPRKGHVFVDADYSAVEARGVAWLFDCKKLVRIFATGGDPYVEIACVIYERQISAADADERWTGKQTILGCFAADTIVLTNNGPKPITRVHTNDLLWDGVEWVRHEGVVYQGHKRTETAYGLTATPDHEILTGRGWQAWNAVRTSPSLFQSALGSARSPSPAGNVRKAGGFSRYAGATVGGRAGSIETICNPAAQPGVTPVQRKRVLGLTARLKAMWQSCLMIGTVNDCSIASQPFLADATLRTAVHSNGMAPAEFRSMAFGTTTALPCSGISRHFQAGITQILNWTAKITTGITSQATFALSRDVKIGSTPVAVYDIVNSGPRHRFTVLTDHGWIIAHNCGYGMGPNKFAAQCEKFGKPVPMELAEKSVRSYREDYPEIPQGWRDMEHAAVQAVLHPGETFEIPNGKIAFRVHRGYLQMALPSGRRLFYKDPFIRYEDKFNTGRKRPVLWFWGINPKTKQWTPEKTWGGTLTENAVQAFCRDLLFGGMAAIEADDIPLVLSVHDQIVAEVPEEDGEWAVRRVRHHLENLPPWAAGFPIKAEPKIAKRFGK